MIGTNKLIQRVIGIILLFSVLLFLVAMLRHWDDKSQTPHQHVLNLPNQNEASPQFFSTLAKHKPADYKMTLTAESIQKYASETQSKSHHQQKAQLHKKNTSRAKKTRTVTHHHPSHPAHHQNTSSKSANEAWTIQVASFSHQNYAQALMKRLKKQQIPTYSENGKRFTRVYVGPFTSWREAHRYQKKLKESVHLHGLIMEHHHE